MNRPEQSLQISVAEYLTVTRPEWYGAHYAVCRSIEEVSNAMNGYHAKG